MQAPIHETALIHLPLCESRQRLQLNSRRRVFTRARLLRGIGTSCAVCYLISYHLSILFRLARPCNDNIGA